MTQEGTSGCLLLGVTNAVARYGEFRTVRAPVIHFCGYFIATAGSLVRRCIRACASYKLRSRIANGVA